MYTEERTKEILDAFTEVLVKADNFSSGGDPKEYKQFWIAFRREGSALLGLSRYLYDTIEALSKQNEKDI